MLQAFLAESGPVMVVVGRVAAIRLWRRLPCGVDSVTLAHKYKSGP